MGKTPVEYKGWNIEGIARDVLKEILDDSDGTSEGFSEILDDALDDYVHREAYLSVYTKDTESAQTVAGMVKEFIGELDDPFEFVTETCPPVKGRGF
jgi:hypothetical protein